VVVKLQDDAVRGQNANLQRIECARKKDEERLRLAEEIRCDPDAKGEGLWGSEAAGSPDLEPLAVRDMIQHRLKDAASEVAEVARKHIETTGSRPSERVARNRNTKRVKEGWRGTIGASGAVVGAGSLISL
jgi:hypothetical protein